MIFIKKDGNYEFQQMIFEGLHYEYESFSIFYVHVWLCQKMEAVFKASIWFYAKRCHVSILVCPCVFTYIDISMNYSIC